MKVNRRGVWWKLTTTTTFHNSHRTLWQTANHERDICTVIVLWKATLKYNHRDFSNRQKMLNQIGEDALKRPCDAIRVLRFVSLIF